MGMSKGSSESGSSSTGKFGQDVWPAQTTALTNMYSDARNLFNQSAGGINANVAPAQSFSNMIANSTLPAYQQQLNGGILNPTHMLNQSQLQQSLAQSLNNPSATQQIYGQMMGGQGNNYVDAMKQVLLNDTYKAQLQGMNALDARAAASGMGGSSRHGIAQGQMMSGLNDSLLKNMASIGYDTFDKDLSNKLNIAQMADANTLARQQMLNQNIYNDISMANQNQQGALTGAQGMQNLGMSSFQPYAAPWMMAAQYANMIGRPTVLGAGELGGDASSSASSFGFGK